MHVLRHAHVIYDKATGCYKGLSLGAVIIRIGSWGMLYSDKEPRKDSTTKP